MKKAIIILLLMAGSANAGQVLSVRIYDSAISEECQHYTIAYKADNYCRMDEVSADFRSNNMVMSYINSGNVVELQVYNKEGGYCYTLDVTKPGKCSGRDYKYSGRAFPPNPPRD